MLSYPVFSRDLSNTQRRPRKEGYEYRLMKNRRAHINTAMPGTLSNRLISTDSWGGTDFCHVDLALRLSLGFCFLPSGAKPPFAISALAAERLAAASVSLPACANVAQCATLAKCRPDAKTLISVSRYSTPRQPGLTNVTHTMADLSHTHAPIAPCTHKNTR